jgi:hypothetical protein
MLNIELDTETGLAIFQPEGTLTAADFQAAAELIDPWLEENEKLSGLIIRTKQFPGWESFGALISHVKFVRNHHRQISHLAFVTDSHLGDLAEKIGNHFVAAEIKHYPFDEFDSARQWIVDG